MKIFISWSGEPSKKAAQALRNWLPFVIQSLEPWVSSTDIEAGERWSPEVNKQLELTDFGILCLTPQNLTAPWILFEAGALAKSLTSSKLCPYLIGVSPSELKDPLAQFQTLNNTKDDTFSLVSAIYGALPSQHINESQLETLFERFWPDLEKKFKEIDVDPPKERVLRSERSLLEEILSDVRSIKRGASYSETSKLKIMSKTPAPLKLIEINLDASLIDQDIALTAFQLDENARFQSFLDDIWLSYLAPHFPADTYGESWIITREKTGEEVQQHEHVDKRTLSELGFSSGENLIVSDMNKNEAQ